MREISCKYSEVINTAYVWSKMSRLAVLDKKIDKIDLTKVTQARRQVGVKVFFSNHTTKQSQSFH